MNILNKKTILSLILFSCMPIISADSRWETFKNYLPALSKKNIIIGGVTAVAAYFLIKKMMPTYATEIMMHPRVLSLYTEQYTIPTSWRIPKSNEFIFSGQIQPSFNQKTNQKRLILQHGITKAELVTFTTEVDDANKATVTRDRKHLGEINLLGVYPSNSMESFIIQKFNDFNTFIAH